MRLPRRVENHQGYVLSKAEYSSWTYDRLDGVALDGAVLRDALRLKPDSKVTWDKGRTGACHARPIT